MTIPAVIAEICSAQGEWEHRADFPPGPQLAICLAGEKNRLSDLPDIELLEAMAAARRQTAWAQARELAAIHELERRRREEADRLDFPGYGTLAVTESVTEEVAATLTLTGTTAAHLVCIAGQLAEHLPATRHALETGKIDFPRAKAICDAVRGLPKGLPQQVEAQVIDQAPELTVGKLRHRIKQAARDADPAAFEQRKREAVKDRRLELWENPHGTADLALRDLATEDAHAIHNRITAAANGLKAEGDDRPLDLIRADLAKELLRGTDLPDAIRSLLAQTAPDAVPDLPPVPSPTLCVEEIASSGCGDNERHATGTVRDADATARASMIGRAELDAHEPGATASVDGSPHNPSASLAPDGGNERRGASETGVKQRTSHDADLALPVSTAASTHGENDRCGGSGADVKQRASRNTDAALASGLATVIDQRLTRLLAHARATGRLDDLALRISRAVAEMDDRLAGFRDLWCRAAGPADRHGHPGYRPPVALRRLIEHRHSTCVFPACDRRSSQCDLDHTRPYDHRSPESGGTTCRCNMAPLCRRHHRCKQTAGWRLFQPWPGLLVWITPSGQWHVIVADRR